MDNPEELEMDWEEMDSMGCFSGQESRRISPLSEEEPDGSSEKKGA